MTAESSQAPPKGTLFGDLKYTEAEWDTFHANREIPQGTYRLNKATKGIEDHSRTLVTLTWVLIVLTTALAILTAVLVWRTF